MKISEDDIDSFVLELHTWIETHPCVDDEAYYACLHEFVHQRFDKFWSPLIKERNYN